MSFFWVSLFLASTSFSTGPQPEVKVETLGGEVRVTAEPGDLEWAPEGPRGGRGRGSLQRRLGQPQRSASGRRDAGAAGGAGRCPRGGADRERLPPSARRKVGRGGESPAGPLACDACPSSR